MTGYIRNDTTNNIANGNVINANDLDGEFDAIQSAFDASTGHTHDGTVGSGAPIEVLGPAQDVVVTASVVRPKTDNAVDLGTSSLEFKNLYLDGTAQVDTLQVDESATITANLTVNGNTTLGNAATDTVTVTADVASSLIPATDNTYDLGTPTDEWRDLYIDGTANIDSLVADTADINGGTIDGAVIGGSSAAAGTFTTATATTGNITTVNATTVDTTNIEVTNIKAKDGTASATIADTTGVMTIASAVLTTADINGGTIDGTTIGGSSAAAGTFTTATATTGNITTVNATTVDTTNIEVTTLKAKDGTSAGSIADSTGVVTLASTVLTTTDINGGTIDGTTIGGSSAAAGTFTTVTASGDVTIADKIVHSGDTNTAIRFPAADTVTVETGGAERMRIDAVGNVGIATTSPAGLLEVFDVLTVPERNTTTIASKRGLSIYNNQSSGSVDTTLVYGNTASSYLAIGNHNGTSYAERMRITSAGNVGIGIAAPIEKLDVRGAIFVGNVASGINYDGMILDYNTSTREARLAVGATSGGSSFFTFTTSNGGVEGERMRIDSAGNVGIGTSVPADYSSSARNLVVGTTSGNNGITIAAGTTSQGSLFFADGTATAAEEAAGYLIYVHSDDSMRVGTANTERARIDSAGNVGIGTNTPSSILNVRGDQIIVSGSSGTSSLGLQIKGAALTALPAAQVQGYIATGDSGIGTAGDLLIAPRTNTTASVRFITGTTPAEAMRINASGNVGIGTTSPATLLDVVGTVTADGLTVDTSTGVLLEGTGTAAIHKAVRGTAATNNSRPVFSFDLDSTGDAADNFGPSISFTISDTAVDDSELGAIGFVRDGADGSGKFVVGQDSQTLGTAPQLTVTSAGNVGIGTTSPATLLSLQAATPTLTSVSTTTTGTTLGDKGNRVLLQSNSSTVGNGGEIVWAAADTNTGRWAAISGHIVGNASGSAFGDVVFATKTAGADTALSERLRLTAAGALVIGNGDTAASPAAGFLRATGGSGTDITGAALNIQGGRGTGTGAGGIISFSTAAAGTTGTTLNAATERMRIDASGNLLVGKTVNDSATVGSVILSGGGGTFTRSGGAVLDINRTTSDGTIVNFRKDNTTVGTISVTGAATAYNTSSDYRLKESIQPIFGASDRVRQLNPVNFSWKADGTRTDGFIAHEVQAVAPQAVTGEKDGEEMQAIDHSKLVPLLTAALQEALTEIALLKARLDAANI